MMEQNPLDLLEPYWRRKWLIIVAAIVGTCISIVYAMSLTKLYRSTTMILVEKQQVSERYVTSTARTPIQERLNTIQQQIMSRTNLEKIIGEHNLYADSKNTPRDVIIESMRNQIEVQIIGSRGRGRGGDAFSISYINKDPKVTMDVTNTLASMFIDENLKRREQSVEGTSDFIGKELERARLALEKQEAELKAFKDKYMGALPSQLDSNLRTLDRLQLEMQTVSDNLKSAMDRKILLDRSLGSGTSTSGETFGSSSAQVSQLMDELYNLKMELSQLRTKYKESYPDVIIAKNRIAEIEEKLELMEEEADSLETVEKKKSPVRVASSGNRETREELFLVKSEVKKLKRRERAIRSEMKMYERRVEQTSTNEQQLTDIKRDYDISNRNYQSLLEKKISAELAENLEKRQKGERFRIIDPAYLPEKPFKPNRMNIVLVGIVLSIGIGAGMIYILELFSPVIRKPEDLEGLIAHPVLAIIPEFPSSQARSKIKVKKELRLVKGGKG